MVVANVNSQNNVNSNNKIEFVSVQKKNDNKHSSTIYFTYPDDKSDKKQTDNIKYFSPNTKNIKLEGKTNITNHLQLHFDGNLVYPENVYVSGNDYIGKIEAHFFNKHPQLLAEYLNKGNWFDVKLSTKQIKEM